MSTPVYARAFGPRILEQNVGPYLPKEDLVDNKTYVGVSTGSRVATWRKDKQRFEFVKFVGPHLFIMELCHPNDDPDYDAFYPTSLGLLSSIMQ